jgi:outer membrane putative beta-barrel porin/alpha-amylase
MLFRSFLKPLLFILLPLIATAGGWPQESGSGFYKIGMQYVSGAKYYDFMGDKLEVPALTDVTWTFYGEHGITNDITLFLSLPFFRIINVDGTLSDMNASSSLSGISDAEIGLRLGLFREGNTVVSAVIAAGLPIGEHDDADNIRFGDGEFNQFIGVQVGHSLHPLPMYLAGEFGINRRHKGFSNELRYGVEAGYSFAQRFLLIFRVFGIQSLRDGDNQYQPGLQTGLYPNNQQYLAYGPEMSYAFNDHWGISAGLSSGLLVRNALSAVAYTAGIYYTH